MKSLRANDQLKHNESVLHVSEPTEADMKVLREAEIRLQEHSQLLRAELDQPLTVNAEGYITGGVFHVNGPFIGTSLYRKAKAKPTKCRCACCGNTHNLKK